jgi:hypothetical protein
MAPTLEDLRPVMVLDAAISDGNYSAFVPASFSSYSSPFSSSFCRSKTQTSASVTPALLLIASLISLALRISGDIEEFLVLGWTFLSL